MPTVDWILFDLGGVLLDVEQPRIFSRLQSLADVPASTIEQRLKSAPFFRDELMIKEFSPVEIAGHVNQVLRTTLSTDEIVDALNSELGAVISSTADLLPTLQRKVKIGCLSNTNSIHWDKLLQSYPFMRSFDRRFASQLLGCAKPHREIYERTADLLSAHPRQILFFDDKLENVESAQRLGWHARQYTGHDRLVADLGEFKVV